eukprot:6203386-Pleurochrysis_carterae.AAC.1
MSPWLPVAGIRSRCSKSCGSTLSVMLSDDVAVLLIFKLETAKAEISRCVISAFRTTSMMRSCLASVGSKYGIPTATPT